MGLQITVETVLGQVVDKSEDCAEKVVSTIRPHAKGLAKVSGSSVDCQMSNASYLKLITLNFLLSWNCF